MKRTFLFPGQGSQHVGMLSKLKSHPATKTLLSDACEILGFDLEKSIEEGSEEVLKKTSVTQPALLITSISHWHSLPASITNDCLDSLFMGHSIGEYAALVARQSFTFETAMSLVAHRGRLMEEFNMTEQKTAMAVLTPKDCLVEDLISQIQSCTDLQVDIAAINSAQQITLSGIESDMTLLRERIGNHGLKILRNVSLPFHGRFMQNARKEFEKYLKVANFTAGNGIFVSNVTGKPADHGELASLLSEQITSTVMWKASIDYALGFSGIEFIEVGPKSTLSNLLRKSGIPNKTSSTAENHLSDLVTNSNHKDP